MRRIYYAYALRLSLHSVTLSLVVFAVSLYALGKLVFVERVVEGFLNIPVRELVPHTIRVLGYADALTLVVFGVCAAAAGYIGFYLMTSTFSRMPRMQLA